MAEWSNAAVLKTASDRKRFRGFESLSFRHFPFTIPKGRTSSTLLSLGLRLLALILRRQAIMNFANFIR